jgi:hypothetical protein
MRPRVKGVVQGLAIPFRDPVICMDGKRHPVSAALLVTNPGQPQPGGGGALGSR